MYKRQSQALQLVVEGSGRIPKIRNQDGDLNDVINIYSMTSVVIDSDFEKSFGNYPNPFGADDKPETKFVYYLNTNTAVNIQIYTLVGELVWSRSFTENDPQGKKGLHNGDITWDARNGNGDKVLNGVYIARISTGDDKHSITKIAVIK